MRVAVGCSYTAGTGIDATETYAHLMGYANWARPGSDIEFALWSAHRAVEQGTTDLLFQLTSWDRITLGDEERHNFVANRPYTGEPKYEHYTIADYANDQQGHIKWLYEQHVMSNWRTENLAQRLVEFYTWARVHGCTVRYYDWLPRNGIAAHPLISNLLPKHSVLDWLGNDYYVDDYYHVNAQGHRRIAGEYFER